MANGEWLTQLMSGLGGAFTGETMARERIALEAEQERKRQEEERRQEEAANERERLRQIQELRRQPFTKELGQQLLGLGDTPQSVAALQDIFVPKTPRKPLIEGVGKDNRRYTFDPNTGETTVSPFEEYRAPREQKSEEPTASDIRAGRAELRGAESGFRSVLASRPRPSQYVDPLTRLPDTTAYNQALQSWRPESAYAAERRKTAGEELKALLGATGGIETDGAPTGGAVVQDAQYQQMVAAEMQRTIQGIMSDPTLTDMEKRQKVQMVNDKATQLLRNR